MADKDLLDYNTTTDRTSLPRLSETYWALTDDKQREKCFARVRTVCVDGHWVFFVLGTILSSSLECFICLHNNSTKSVLLFSIPILLIRKLTPRNVK